MKYCVKCGTQNADDALFCVACGHPFNNPTKVAINKGNIQGRNIVLAVILSIITCGIYAIYWLYCLNEEMNQLTNDTQATSGGLVILFSIITCGIYSLYWVYKMGEKADQLNNSNSSSSIIYLILSLFGFGIVVYILLQDTINKAISYNG